MDICYKFKIHGDPSIIGVGMIGNILVVLQVIYHNINNNVNIYIDQYSNGNCIVYDKQYTEDTNIINPFDYYFQQNTKHNNNNYFLSNSLPIELSYGACNFLNCDLYKKLKNLFFKNFKIKDDIINIVDSYILNNFNNNIVLGVQIRLTDMIFYHKTHDIYYFIKRVNEILNTHKIDKIFVSTDNEEAINIFIKNVNHNNILFQKNIERENSINSNVGMHYKINTNKNIINNRIYHNYHIGKEVLIDTLILSKCDYLLRSRSAVSDVAIIFNENIKEIFV